ncbi:adenylate isopentenyltransferase 3, chloroplastic-like [Amaranthus tricolor]|uniref:adenylate isopentenyltransferase 3, chloroplastic-like n=1 Tax=Amaranthus tricolor TaxID=29722 RepID=UPI00259053B5|nr:adenylate isopentenyltransferase 3, chloroplastic-like [Amaranthus tricolor]
MNLMMRSLPKQMWEQAKPFLKYPTSLLNKELHKPWKQPRNNKVVFIMGATGTGKSRLSIDLATIFQAEIINSDKIQIYKGLDILTNKVTKEEQCGIPHHLLSIVNPNVDYTTKDFCLMATHGVESILQKEKLPIIVGGSNSYIESLVMDPKYGFKSKFDCCFLWVDVNFHVLKKFVAHRVDKMVQSGLVEEIREVFDPYNSDYTRGIRQAIGVAELDNYFRNEKFLLDHSSRVNGLQNAIKEIKKNTCNLANKQIQKIHCLRDLKGWDLNRIDATQILKDRNKDAADQAWQEMVVKPSLEVVTRFLSNTNDLEFDLSARSRVLTRTMIRNGCTFIPIAT